MSTKITLVLALLALTALLTAPAALESGGVDVADATPFGSADALLEGETLHACASVSGDLGNYHQCIFID